MTAISIGVSVAAATDRAMSPTGPGTKASGRRSTAIAEMEQSAAMRQ
jgi:hypothetical protein